MSTIHLEVQGMSCGGCVKNVTAALKPLAGVSTVDVDLQAGQVTVNGELPQGGDPLVLALTAAGYPAKAVTGTATASAPGTKKSGGCCG
ncbi:MAG: heavy-metal-associated domain-containing protein [Polaromonas sp.]|nr:heavy-metal-associated domain-containing protein [Polaromonas sp.]